MIKQLLTVTGIFATIFLSAQKNFWNPIQKVNLTGKVSLSLRKSTPTEYKLYHLDFEGIKFELAKAPERMSKNESLVLKFPKADGTLVDYVVREASVFSKDLAAKYPGINSYLGYEKGHQENTIRFSTSPYDGLNIMYFDGWNASYLDTYTNDNQNYIVYERKNLPQDPGVFQCDFDKVNAPQETNTEGLTLKAPLVKDGTFRTYRLALACTLEYSTYQINRLGVSGGTIAEKKAAVLSAMNTSMTRVDGVYEKSLSLTMVLVPNDDQLVFVDTTVDDGYTNNDGGTMLSQNQTIIDAAIGTANYDIGHVFSTGGGGVAYLRVPCTASKAGGVTGTSAPVGDAYDIDYVAHEMGHQFGGNHTFRSNTGSCAGNANNSTAMEPGSGSTIMAYAGICGTANNIQAHSDPYFHSVNMNEMYNFISKTTDCSAKISNGNSVPTADAGLDYTIPFGTAFVLTGVGTDPDGDALTYLWEETDFTNNTQPPVSTATVGPIFRSLLPTASAQRYFPNMTSILANTLNPKWEMIPTVARTFNFSLLVNDNKATGNQAARDLMIVTVANAGPFKVTSQTTNVAYDGGSILPVTWDVAGTDAAPINTQNVKILLSTNAGVSFDTVLAASVPNNGSASVTLPNLDVASARLMVMPIDNIYLAVNSSAFSITKTLAVSETDNSKVFALFPNPAKGEINITLNKFTKGAEYQIFDASGRLINKGIFTSDKNKINISNLKTGVYKILVNSNGESISKNLIVK